MTRSKTVLIVLVPAIMAASAAIACPSGDCPTTQAGSTSMQSQGPSAQRSTVPAAMAPVRGDAAATATASGAAATLVSDEVTSGAYLQRRGVECADFTRGGDAGWIAARAVVFPAPEGPLRVEAGTVYHPGQFAGGYDLGSMLEHDCPSR